jgi:hypothetical protein
MTSPIIPAGFNGPVNESDEANRFALNTPRFVVASSTDLTPTAVTTSDRTVSVAPGAATCCGVYAAMATAQSVTFAVNGSASVRVDLVVLRWTWGRGAGSGGVPSVALGVVQGTPGAGAPAPVRTPGTLYEAVLAAVVINPSQGGLTPASVNDIRTYGGIAGPLVIPQVNYYTSVDVPVGGLLAIGSPTGRVYTQTATARVASLSNPPLTAGAAVPLGAAWDGVQPVFQDRRSALATIGGSGGFNITLGYTAPNGMQPDLGSGDSPVLASLLLANMTSRNNLNGQVFQMPGATYVPSGQVARINWDVLWW